MPFIGEISALAAAIFWAGISIVFTTVAFRIGAIQLNIDRMILAAIFLLITIFAFSIDFTVNLNQILFLTISGFIGLVLGDTFLFKSFQEIGPRVTMLIYSINPAIAAILAYFFLGEVMEVLAITGVLVTLTGIAVVVMEKPNAENKFKTTRKGLMYALLGAAGQAIGLIFAKGAYSYGDIHSLTATFVRIASAAIVMLPLGILFKKYKNPIKLYFKERKTFNLVILGSIIGPYLGISLSFVALTNTKIGIAATLMSTVPVIVLPLTWYFYKEKLTFISIAGAFITVAGVSMLFL
ncbi:MAG: DMT family transporter [Candidatus Kapabacteria bacterium]|nr:DMT family transporter [Ignavibacteriota bacterium]MCW5884008.1 DMT family transporter [Candidatus Kapabacteria bacterium]